MVDIKVQKLTPAGLQAELRRFETEYAMKSGEFYEKFNRGEMGDSQDVIEWAGLYEVALIRKRRRVKA